MPAIDITIINKLGLHARAAAKFSAAAASFQSQVQVKKAEKVIDAKSIMQVMMLAASMGTELTLIANGTDAEQALAALEALINDKFGEGQ